MPWANWSDADINTGEQASFSRHSAWPGNHRLRSAMVSSRIAQTESKMVALQANVSRYCNRRPDCQSLPGKPHTRDYFGSSIDIDNGIIVTGGPMAGSAYLFDASSGTNRTDFPGRCCREFELWDSDSMASTFLWGLIRTVYALTSTPLSARQRRRWFIEPFAMSLLSLPPGAENAGGRHSQAMAISRCFRIPQCL